MGKYFSNWMVAARAARIGAFLLRDSTRKGALNAFVWLALGHFSVLSAAEALKQGPTYHGMCDASGAVAIDAERFVVANDEDSTLRIYRRDKADAPITEIDFAEQLKVGTRESDLEGACWLDGRIYWITSHGRNKKGKAQESRNRLFATEVDGKGDSASLKFVGTAYEKLLDDLVDSPKLAKYDLGEASQRAPKKKGGLNIEGLSAGPNGSLLVGFRNPVPNRRAIVVPLLNPKAVVDSGERAKIGDPIELDLSVGQAKLSIRSIDYDAERKLYWIVGGSYESGGKFALFRWTGDADSKPTQVEGLELGTLSPECVFVYPGKGGQVCLLSDDGSMMVGPKECKKVADESKRSFRSALLVE
jgi:hypothetical protein